MITLGSTLSPIIMEVEKGYIWKVTTFGGTHFWRPWLWEAVYKWAAWKKVPRIDEEECFIIHIIDIDMFDILYHLGW